MISIISGTNRINSNTLKVARYYQQQLNIRNAKCQVISLNDLPSDFINTDLYGKRSSAFADLQTLVSASEKFVFIVPEYNGSFPGVLKTFLDACDFPQSFYGKKAALVGVSSGKYGNIRGIDHLTGVCNYMSINVLPLKIHISNVLSELNQEENFYKSDTLKFTNQQIEEFLVF